MNKEEQKTLIITVGMPNSENMEMFQQYVQEASKIANQYGVKPVAKYGVKELLIGNVSAGFISIAEFNNEEDIKSMFFSDAYKKLIPLRDKGLKSVNVYIVKQ